MKTSSRLKTVLLAAASLTAASVAAAHAAVAPTLAPAAIEYAVGTANEDSERAAPVITVKKAGVAAAITAALAGLARLIGLRRIKAATAAASRAASIAVRATGKAAGAVMRAASSPLRFILMFAGLSLVAFAGVGFYDVEWAAGLVFGAFFAASVILGARRARRGLANRRSAGVR